VSDLLSTIQFGVAYGLALGLMVAGFNVRSAELFVTGLLSLSIAIATTRIIHHVGGGR
jgi:hypothetical protein